MFVPKTANEMTVWMQTFQLVLTNPSVLNLTCDQLVEFVDKLTEQQIERINKIPQAPAKDKIVVAPPHIHT